MIIALTVLSIIQLLGLIFLIIKYLGSNNQSDLQRVMNESQANMFQGLSGLNTNLQNSLQKDFHHLRESVVDKLDRIGRKVQENMDEGFKKTNDTFSKVIERLAKIDEAQKKIESLSSNVVDLQHVLTDKKSRGIFGEVQLNQILFNVFGEGNNNVFQTQYSFSNGKMVDAVLFLPDPIGTIGVDSKFPLENFKKMVDKTLPAGEREVAEKEFTKNLKKHIDDISSKYIISGETSDQAIMFLPAEAIFAEINAYHPTIVDYAQSKKVWITSPTTFMATLTTIQTVLMNLERNKYMNVIHEEINKLGIEFERYQERWDDLAKHIGTVSKDVDKIHITGSKISKRFQSIVALENSSID
ncbi:MAG: DNA recombination protein RmuC [Oligoflexia bacterium]|nr:DNA recombination protein RmuC [Oligoflexia bacterium]